MTDVLLKCVAQGGKLRVRILSNGYYKDSNVQFPRALRVEGCHYRVPPNAISLITTRGKYFYSVTKKPLIKIVEEVDVMAFVLDNLKVYEDASTCECAICFANPKSIVMVPCGHFYTCEVCTSQLKQCPICRAPITSTINKSLMD